MAIPIKIVKKDIDPSNFASAFSVPLFAVFSTLVTSSLLLWLLGYPILPTFEAFFVTPLSTVYEFSEVLMKATVLVIIGLGLAVGFRANVWNIGAEGQFVFGAIGGSVVALYFHGQEGFHIIPLMIIAGILGGMFWGMIPALLKTKYDANEILSSLMLVYIAQLFLSYLTHGPLRDPDGLNFPQTVYFSESAIYPYLIEGTRLSITPFLLLALYPFLYLLLKRSYIGYQMRVTGLSPVAARFAGFSTKKMVWVSFLLCGGLAGLAGISEVSANISQLVPIISPGYGFTAIIVAFLGRLNPIGILFSGFLLALVFIGAQTAQIELGLPVSIGGIFQGLILFNVLAADFVLQYRIQWGHKAV